LTLEITDDTLEIGLIQDGFLLRGAEEERSTADIVDLAGHAFGVIVDEGQERIRKDRILATGDAEMVLDVGGSLLEVERFEVVADGDALVERLEGGEVELVGQVGLSDEDEGERRGGIHLVVEGETELVEDGVREEMGLVDDEEDGAALAGQVGEGGVELR